MAKNKIDRFLDTVYSAAEAKSEKMIREIDRAGEAAIREYRAEKRRSTDAERRRESMRAARLGAENAAHDESEIKRTLLERRSAIADEVFSEVRRRIEEYRRTPEYKSALLRDAAAAADRLAGMAGAVIMICPDDEAFAAEIQDAAGIPVKTDASIILGGVRGGAETAECDLTLDCRFEAARAAFAKESGLSVV